MAAQTSDRPLKRARLLSDDEESGSDISEATRSQLKINSEFARRFEHNKKREDLQRLQEKYGKDDGSDTGGEESSEDESEDEAAELITHELDDEIMGTLKALRSKDPRIYDKHSEFYKTPIDAAARTNMSTKKDKAVTLRDYHRENLLHDKSEKEAEGNLVMRPMTYNEEQAALKQDLVDQMHNVEQDDDGSNASDEDGFFAKKPVQKQENSQNTVMIDEKTIANADKDPEAYLDKFMSTRAWEQNDPKFQPFDSDDSEDDARAEEFEQAYNMRFEDPERSNEKLISHSRTAAAQHSARREELSGRQKARQREREQKASAKRQRDEEKQRLRRLRLDAAQEKLNKFKEVAGLKGKDISDQAWEKFMNSDWDDGNWEKEIAGHFDDEYYAAQDFREDGEQKSSRGPKKPKWDDDIDIDDIVPDFDEEEARAAMKYTLSDDEAAGDETDGGVPLDGDTAELSSSGQPEPKEQKESSKEKKRARDNQLRERKRQARREKMRLEELVDKNMTEDVVLGDSDAARGFRYRETSPGGYGLSAREILMADDAQLNEFVGLKKLATFRDEEKKQRDRKKLGKKDRLRKWRKETFGDKEGPTMSFQEFLQSRIPAESRAQSGKAKSRSSSNIIEREGESSKRKKNHRGGKKRKAAEQS